MREHHRASTDEAATRRGLAVPARGLPDTAVMDIRDPSNGDGPVRRAQGEVRSMAVPTLVIALVLIVAFVPLRALIWGRKVPPSTVAVPVDAGAPRLRVRHPSEP